jgi:hypothetical protein
MYDGWQFGSRHCTYIPKYVGNYFTSSHTWVSVEVRLTNGRALGADTSTTGTWTTGGSSTAATPQSPLATRLATLASETSTRWVRKNFWFLNWINFRYFYVFLLIHSSNLNLINFRYFYVFLLIHSSNLNLTCHNHFTSLTLVLQHRYKCIVNSMYLHSSLFK